MKEVIEILNELETSQKAKVLDYVSQLEEDCVLLKDEQKDLLNSLDILYKRNHQLHERMEKLRDSVSGKELTKLMEENQKLQTELQQTVGENQELRQKLQQTVKENQELQQKLQQAFNTLDDASALLDL